MLILFAECRFTYPILDFHSFILYIYADTTTPQKNEDGNPQTPPLKVSG